ncbi:MAG TPA: ABC transporter permease [Gemmatimonadaceae bacterium]|nr:ABC transporter permease [Gemmatimonadaceae bacterium]
MRNALTDLARGIRLVRSSPRLVIVAGVTVAIGVAAPTVMFSIVHGFLRDLPFAEGHRLVYVTRAERIGAARDVGLTPRELREWQGAQRSLEALAGFSLAPMIVGGGDGVAGRYSGARMSASGFRALRVAPRLGAAYGARDEESGERVVVISDRLWRSRFGASTAAIGSSIRLNGRPTRVLGVMPPGFHFPFNEDLWTPLGAPALGSMDDTVRSLQGFGRLTPGVGLEYARSEFALLGGRTAAPAAADLATRAVSFKESQIEPSDVVLFRAMLVVVMFVLVVACANVGNLLLVRATARVPMFAVKRALGASPATVVREIMAESAVIAFVGGLGGAGLALVGVHLFNVAVGSRIPFFWMRVAVDAPVLAFAAALAAAAVLLAGAGPAVYSAHVNPEQVLRASGRGTAGARRHGLTGALIVGEIAVTFVLLVVAGLIAKGVVGESRGRLAFDPAGVVTASIDLNPAVYDDSGRADAMRRTLDVLATDPAFGSAALSTTLAGMPAATTRLTVGGVTYLREDDRPSTRLALVSPGFFEAFRLRLVAGRVLSAGDTRASTAVAVVNRSFADAHLAGLDPIGARIRLGALGDSAWLTVVGVVGDAGTVSRAKGASEAVYASVQQFTPARLFVSARAADNSAAALRRLAQHVRGVGPDIPVQDVRRLDRALADARAIPRMFAVLFASFGGAALVLAVVGLYGVVAFTARQRARELSIRNALGAPALHLAAAVVGRTGAQVAVGLVGGAGLAALITPLLMDILFGADPHDVAVHGAAACSVVLAAVAAIAGPLSRAVRMPPAAALRLG